MKSIISLLLLSSLGLNTFAQKKQIVKLLNEALQEEISIQDSTHRFGYLIKEVIQPHHIVNDSLKIKLVLKYNDRPKETIITQQIALKDIGNVGKDINVYFWSGKPILYLVESYAENGQDKITEKYHRESYFAYVYSSQNNEILGQKLQRAFARAGYKIKLHHWLN